MSDDFSTSETAQTVQPMTLCEHCPFAPQSGEGTGQESVQEKALSTLEKTQEIDRQMPLPFEGEWSDPIEEESTDSKPFNDIAQRLAEAYLYQAPDRLHSETLLAIDLADGDRPDIKAELERLQQTTDSHLIALRGQETEAALSETQREGQEAEAGVENKEETPVFLPTEETDNATSSTQAWAAAKGTSHRLAGEQKGTAQPEGQHLAQTPSREASKDGQTTEHERT